MERLQQIENLAKAFYNAQGHALSWGRASEALKEEFRAYARDAVSLLEDNRQVLNPLIAASFASSSLGAGLASP